MGIYQILCLIGVPSICVSALGVMHKRLKSMKDESQALRLGIQALLRDRLLQAYHFYMDQGSITYGELNNITNLYNNYHALGANGVMDKYYERLMNLPTTEGE